MAGPNGSAIYALWVQQANKNPTAGYDIQQWDFQVKIFNKAG